MSFLLRRARNYPKFYFRWFNKAFQRSPNLVTPNQPLFNTYLTIIMRFGLNCIHYYSNCKLIYFLLIFYKRIRDRVQLLKLYKYFGVLVIFTKILVHNPKVTDSNPVSAINKIKPFKRLKGFLFFIQYRVFDLLLLAQL